VWLAVPQEAGSKSISPPLLTRKSYPKTYRFEIEMLEDFGRWTMHAVLHTTVAGPSEAHVEIGLHTMSAIPYHLPDYMVCAMMEIHTCMTVMNKIGDVRVTSKLLVPLLEYDDWSEEEEPMSAVGESAIRIWAP
jgi:hypothetical protein